MKTTPTRILAFTACLALSGLAFTACSKQDRASATASTKEVVSDTKDAFSNAWDSVKAHTWEKRSDFNANAKALSAKMEANLSELHANYSEAKASSSRKAAMAELKNSDADYRQKVDALGHATADTWNSAKQNVIASWDRLQASYRKARAD